MFVLVFSVNCLFTQQCQWDDLDVQPGFDITKVNIFPSKRSTFKAHNLSYLL